MVYKIRWTNGCTIYVERGRLDKLLSVLSFLERYPDEYRLIDITEEEQTI